MFETGTIVGLVWLALVVTVMLVSGFVLLIGKANGYAFVNQEGSLAVFGVSGALSLITLIISAFVFFPYQTKYLQWEAKEGIVSSVSFDAKADTSTRSSGDWAKGGLRMTLGDGTAFYTTDFHLATKKPGEKVLLMCQPSYQQANVDRIDCKSQMGSL